MKDVILTTDLYHRHADPNDHWNLASMYSLACEGLINFAGIMCDDDRSMSNDGSFLHFGDPSVQSIAQLNYITGMAVPVGFGSRIPIKKKEDLDKVLKEHKKISSVTLLLNALQNSKHKVDIHMCGSSKDVLIAYKYAPELFKEKCDCIYLNAGTYAKQDPIEYNVSLEPYAFSQIFKIPCKIMWSPCFDELRPYPYISAKRANYYEIEQKDSAEKMSDALKKYFNFMYSHEKDVGWLSYLREPLNEELFNKWSNEKRQMWSTPGFLLSANKIATEDGRIVDKDSGETPLYEYKPVKVSVDDNGLMEYSDCADSNVYMFENTDPEKYNKAMGKVVAELLSKLPDMK